MRAKRVLALVVALAFAVGSAGIAFAADLKGTVTKIDGKMITIRDAGGKEVTAEADAAGIKPGEIKPGDLVEVRDGKVHKVAAEKKKRAIEGC